MEKENQETKNSVIPSKFDSRFVFSDSLIRTTRLVSEEKSIENMIMSTQLPYVFTEDPIPLEFDYNLEECLIKESYTKICWVLTNKNIPSPIQISFHLTENTIEKNVFVIFEIELIKRKLIPVQCYEKINKSFPNICVEMIKNLNQELEEDNKDIYHYESKILEFSRELIWDIISNFHLKMFEAGVIKNLTIKTPIKEGCEFCFNISEDNKFFKMKVIKIKCDQNNDKWALSIKPINGPFDHDLQEWILIKLDENKSLLANNTKYTKHMNPDELKNISEQKKLTFKTIEDMLKSDNEKNKNIIINKYFQEGKCKQNKK
jgi:hypothetical protein